MVVVIPMIEFIDFVTQRQLTGQLEAGVYKFTSGEIVYFDHTRYQVMKVERYLESYDSHLSVTDKV